MQKATKPEIIQDKLDNLELGGSIIKDSVIKQLYGHNDFFTSRSFDVHYCKAKKNLPNKVFKVKDGIIQRIK